MSSFRPALVVVDLQEDFCPPSGPLTVPNGRDIAPLINNLMTLPFTIRIATLDWHPLDHVSFASNHPPPNNKPYTSTVDVPNPSNPSETETIRIWPNHCVQNSPGAELIPEFDASKIDHVVKKGQDSRVEMYSAFKDTYKNPCHYRSGLAQVLKEAGTTHVYVVGLAMDYCVKWTAIDAVEEGWETFVIEEAVRGIDTQSKEGLDKAKAAMEEAGVKVVSIDGEQVGWVKQGRK